MEAKSVHGEDRLSELPVHIIHHILCQTDINPKDAARTCVLSKRWYYCWTSRPILVLDQELEPYTSTYMSWEEFVKLVDQSLRPHVEQNLRLEQFTLKCGWTFDHRPRQRDLAYHHIDRWIDLVVKLNVRVLKIQPRNINPYYSLPDAIFAAKELTILELYWCKFEFDIKTTKITTFSNLKELFLWDVHIFEEQFQTLTSRCPFITTLSLSNIQGMNKLHVRGLVHLETLGVELCKFESVVVQAPNLRIFTNSQEFDPLPCKIKIMDAYNTLHTLILERSSITEQQFQDIFSEHSNISELYLFSCNGLKNIEIVSEKLKTLTLVMLKNLEQVKIQAPNLMKVHFEVEGHKMPFSSMDPFTLETASLSFGDLDTSSHINLSHFIQKFNYSKGLMLAIFCKKSENILIYEDPREFVIPPSNEVQILIRPMLHLASLINDLLNMYPKTMSILPSTNNKVLQVMPTLVQQTKTKTKCFYGQQELKKVSIDITKKEMDTPWHHWLKSMSLFDHVTTFMFKWKKKSSK
ncbi:hypothetical protein HAX54_012992 [Datura stramonium]|uniref:F-box domain-containing protein n=1 Tax=Datura stramonium TaxID=4076 RepID=A0ABS8RY29_DATST|nr:hypothetical protein [Datura stramonium]